MRRFVKVAAGLLIAAGVIVLASVYVAERLVGWKNPEMFSFALLDAVSEAFQRDLGVSQDLGRKHGIWDRPLCSYDAASQTFRMEGCLIGRVDGREGPQFRAVLTFDPSLLAFEKSRQLITGAITAPCAALGLDGGNRTASGARHHLWLDAALSKGTLGCEGRAARPTIVSVDAVKGLVTVRK